MMSGTYAPSATPVPNAFANHNRLLSTNAAINLAVFGYRVGARHAQGTEVFRRCQPRLASSRSRTLKEERQQGHSCCLLPVLSQAGLRSGSPPPPSLRVA